MKFVRKKPHFALDLAEKRSAFIEKACSALTSSLDLNVTLNQAASIGIPDLADWCIVDLLLEDQQTLYQPVIAHSDPAHVERVRELRRKFPPVLGTLQGVWSVIQNQKSVILPVAGEQWAMTAPAAEHRAILMSLDIRSIMLVPLIARGVAIGSLTLATSESGRNFNASDLSMAEALGRIAALAIDNSRLYTKSQRAIQLRDEFLTVASHELSTPMTSLRLQLPILNRYLTGNLPFKLSDEQLKSIIHNSDLQLARLAQLVQELLDISRINSGKPLTLDLSLFDLVDLAIEVRSRFEFEAKKQGCEILIHAKEKVIGRWDRSRLDQVIVNLISNALKYAPGKPVEISISPQSDHVVLTVRDFGIGIALEDQVRIFKKFERAVSARQYGGLGLGLAITESIVHLHGGRISVESQEGQGALFKVDLPTNVMSRAPR